MHEGINLYTSVHPGIIGRPLEMSNAKRHKSDINLLVVLPLSSDFQNFYRSFYWQEVKLEQSYFQAFCHGIQALCWLVWSQFWKYPGFDPLGCHTYLMFSDTGADGKVITAIIRHKIHSLLTPNTHKYVLLFHLTNLMSLFKFINVRRR